MITRQNFSDREDTLLKVLRDLLKGLAKIFITGPPGNALKSKLNDSFQNGSFVSKWLSYMPFDNNYKEQTAICH